MELDDLKKLLYERFEQSQLINFLNHQGSLEYLSIVFGTFQIIDGRAYNTMFFNIIFGTRIHKVVYWSLKHLQEPIHFTQLAHFIREHNKKFSNIPDISIHSALIRLDFCHDVDRGTYGLKEFNFSRHVSAGDAILNLLKENGPMLESEIKHKLKDSYSDWNITLAINNNLHKLIKIGNNLYDRRDNQ